MLGRYTVKTHETFRDNDGNWMYLQEHYDRKDGSTFWYVVVTYTDETRLYDCASYNEAKDLFDTFKVIN